MNGQNQKNENELLCKISDLNNNSNNKNDNIAAGELLSC